MVRSPSVRPIGESAESLDASDRGRGFIDDNSSHVGHDSSVCGDKGIVATRASVKVCNNFKFNRPYLAPAFEISVNTRIFISRNLTS